jgi:hypothetical protein
MREEPPHQRGRNAFSRVTESLARVQAPKRASPFHENAIVLLRPRYSRR